MSSATQDEVRVKTEPDQKVTATPSAELSDGPFGLATQQLGDVSELDGLIGTRFVFGLETAAEARRGLDLLGLDTDDDALVQRVHGFRRGRCLMRTSTIAKGKYPELKPLGQDIIEAQRARNIDMVEGSWCVGHRGPRRDASRPVACR